MRYSLRLLSLLVFALIASIATQAFSVVVSFQPPLGTFQMRPELVGQHPRLFFTAADLPELRRRADNECKFFVQRARTNFGMYRGTTMPDPVVDWKQYLYGNWALITFDMLAVVDDDQSSLATAKDWALTLSQTDWWIEDNLAHMDTLGGLAMTYDVLYDYFTEAERAQIRSAIYDGIMFISNRFFIDQYYTHDYQNNHMQNRMCGLAMAAFAIYGDDPNLNVQPQADLAIQQIYNMLDWLPDDGSQHEGPGYWSFGHHWVAQLVQLAEHVTGEDLVSNSPHMQNSHLFRLYMTAPGWNNTLNIGDAGDGKLENVTSMIRGISESGDANSQSVIENFMQTDGSRFYQHAIWGLLWYDGSLDARPVDELPLGHFWPDLEMFSVRSGWDDDAVAFVFKCGPLGGHTMQQIRGNDYINVAHDHPDQNHFLLYAYGKMLAADDGYPKVQKLTANHNSIIIDGNGQPREGGGWSQPFDYSLSGRMLDEFISGDTAFATGDASACYEEALRFHRHAFFVDGRYAVLIDDLIGYGTRTREFQWRLHNDGDWETLSPTHYSVSEGTVSLDITFLNNGTMTADYLTAAEAEPCLAMTQMAQSAEFISVLVPRKDWMAPLVSQRLPSAMAKAVQVDGDGSRDYIVVTTSSFGPGIPDLFMAGPLVGQGVAAVACTNNNTINSLMLVRGNLLINNGTTFVQTSANVNLSYKAESDGVLIEIAPPYKSAALGTVNVKVAGFEAGKDYTVYLDGVADGSAIADASGTISLDVDVFDTRSIFFDIPSLAANAGPDQTLTDANDDGVEIVTLDGSQSIAVDPAASYYWTLEDGTLIGLAPVTATVLPIGTHTITLRLVDSQGQQSVDTVDITVQSGGMPGDCNGDGHVDISDFVILKQNYGLQSGATVSQGDFNDDGAVDIADFVILKQNYGS